MYIYICIYVYIYIYIALHGGMDIWDYVKTYTFNNFVYF